MPIQERYIDSDGAHTDGTLKISLQNRAFRYGDGVFETILVRHGEPVAFGLHFSRLDFGLSRLWMQCDNRDFRQEVVALVEKLLIGQDQDSFGRMRITAYRSDGGAYLPTNNAVQLLGEIIPLASDPWALGPPKNVIVGTAPPASEISLAKTLNALPYVIEARKAEHQGFEDALLCLRTQEISELTSSNFFTVCKGQLRTPPLESGCLPGTMRARVMMAAHELGIPVIEDRLFCDDLKFATEAFATNAIMGLQPIGTIMHAPYRNQGFPVMMQLREKILQMRA
jgi:branched-chain amino acid aminotransferase